MSPVTRKGWMAVEVRITADPTGRPAILLQLPDGFVLIKHAEHAREVAQALLAAADDLSHAEEGSA